MTNLGRLTLELSNRYYLSDDEYSTLLAENGLDAQSEYDVSNRRALLMTVLDVLEILANDVDLFRKIETEFSTTSEAYTALSDRISRVKAKISDIDAESGQRCESSIWNMYIGGLG